MALMPRTARHAPAGLVDHALNRAVAQLPLLEKDADGAAFECVIEQPHERVPLRILGFTLMGNHPHFVVWPQQQQNEHARRNDSRPEWH